MDSESDDRGSSDEHELRERGNERASFERLETHEVTLVKTSHSMHNETFNYVCAHNNEITLWQEGEEQTARIHAVTTDLSSVATADELRLISIL